MVLKLARVQKHSKKAYFDPYLYNTISYTPTAPFGAVLFYSYISVFLLQ